MIELFIVILKKLKFRIIRGLKRLKDRLLLDFIRKSSHNLNMIKDQYLILNIFLFDDNFKKNLGYNYRIYQGSICKHYLNHEFNFLGTGWKKVKAKYSTNGNDDITDKYCLKQNVNFATNILKNIWNIHNKYELIDWQIDFLNEFSWNGKCLSKRLKYRSGVDIKIPWELGRCQHLPQLALYYCSNLHIDGDAVKRQNISILQEFKAQVLDFIAFNPPKYGVQWFYAMDVAIRVSNWLIAYDIFLHSGAEFKQYFQKIFIRSIYEHGYYIFNNLERYVDTRANHYYTNIIGLLFICFYLPSNKITWKWLKLAVVSFIEEFEFQFFEDGGNIEGSTAYHRLVSELVLWGTILIEKLPSKILIVFHKKFSAHKRLSKYISDSYSLDSRRPFFSELFYSKLALISEFLQDVTKPDGTAWLVGDNDNGRLFKFTVEKELFHSHDSNLSNICESPHFIDTSALFLGFYNQDYTFKYAYYSIEQNVVSSIMHSNIEMLSNKKSNKNCHNISKYIEQSVVNSGNNVIYRIRLMNNRGDIGLIKYSDFGIYIYRSEDMFLGIRCGGIIRDKITSHRHSDQMSIELYCNGEHVILDPGIPTYNSDNNLRDFYRSDKAHFVPLILSSLNIQKIYLLKEWLVSRPIVLYADTDMFLSYWQFNNKGFYRKIRFLQNSLIIEDFFRSFNVKSEQSLSSIKNVKFSPSYGIISHRPIINNNWINV